MATSLSWLRTCKLKQLEAITRATGINSTGTKAILISNIQSALSEQQQQQHETTTSLPTTKTHRLNDLNILSIDMGIRNLAYCRLSLPSAGPSLHPTKPRDEEGMIPTLTHWARVDVSKTATPVSSTPPLPSSPPQKEHFDPSTYATHAHSLLTRTLLPLRPTHILIERQRFRSMGGSAVQEWTLRVNMFEAMLYATLHTLRQSKQWTGTVVPMEPARVARFWIGDGGGEVGEGKGKGKGEKTKKRKMAIARQLVGTEKEVRVEGQAREVLVGKSAGRKTGEGEGKVGKFDDLADSLLQGLAWVRWEENRRMVREKGPDVLEELLRRSS